MIQPFAPHFRGAHNAHRRQNCIPSKQIEMKIMTFDWLSRERESARRRHTAPERKVNFVAQCVLLILLCLLLLLPCENHCDNNVYASHIRSAQPNLSYRFFSPFFSLSRKCIQKRDMLTASTILKFHFIPIFFLLLSVWNILLHQKVYNFLCQKSKFTLFSLLSCSMSIFSKFGRWKRSVQNYSRQISKEQTQPSRYRTSFSCAMCISERDCICWHMKNYDLSRLFSFPSLSRSLFISFTLASSYAACSWVSVCAMNPSLQYCCRHSLA